MPFVVIAPFLHLMIPVLKETEGMYFIKRKGPKGYFYYSGKLPLVALINHVKKILRTKVGAIYVFDVYGMYSGMTDVTPYLSKETKDKKSYYTNPVKELSDAELALFKEKNHLN